MKVFYAFATGAMLTLPVSTQAVAQETDSQTQPSATPKNPSVLVYTTKGDPIWNPEIIGPRGTPSATATYIGVGLPATESISEDLALDEKGGILFKDGNYVVTKTEASTDFYIIAIYAEKLDNGSCAYSYYYNIPSIALSENPTAPLAIRDMRATEEEFKINPNSIYKPRETLGTLKCPAPPLLSLAPKNYQNFYKIKFG